LYFKVKEGENFLVGKFNKIPFSVLDKYNPPDHFLPESYTCFFLLKMPRYSCKVSDHKPFAIVLYSTSTSFRPFSWRSLNTQFTSAKASTQTIMLA
jgi:hypothetical protein